MFQKLVTCINRIYNSPSRHMHLVAEDIYKPKEGEMQTEPALLWQFAKNPEKLFLSILFTRLRFVLLIAKQYRASRK